MKRVTVGDIAQIVSGGTPSRNRPEFWGGRIPWVKTGAIDFCWIREANEWITEEGLENSAARIIPAGTILMAMYGQGKTRGQVAILGIDAAINQACAALILQEGCDRDFVYQQLAFRYASIRKMSNSGGQDNLNADLVRNIAFPLPDEPEQRKIGEVLKTWDCAISTLESVIVGRAERKRGLMQQLLTGKTRFKQFRGERWRTFRLGELFTERVEIGRTDLPLVAITGQNGVVPRDSLTKRDSSSEDKSKYLRITPGDIGYNTMRMWQGVAGLSQIEGIVSPAYTICIPSKQIDAQFAAYLFKHAPMIHSFRRNSQGLVDDTLSLKFPNFARIHVTIPDVPEQKRIAAVLNTCDREIELLEKQLEALKEQKRGLMQKLLTGEIRVKV